MGRHRKELSEETKEYIRENYNSMTVQDMAGMCCESASKIYRFMNEENIYRHIPAKGKIPHAAPEEGSFNVFSRENWLI